MPTLQLKPTYKVVKAYYDELHNLQQLSLFTEGAVSPTFAALLRHCAGQFDWTLAEQFTLKRKGRNIRVDGALLDPFKLLHGVWEAKDTHDDLEREVEKKFNAGYPQDNILFQAPQHAILWQDGYEVLNTSLTHPTALVDVMQQFFAYQPPAFEQWEQAVAEFKVRVPDLATGLLNLIRAEYRTNLRFIRAFDDFAALCRQTLNPNIAIQAVEEMLIQHLLTERIFRKVFDNPDFVERNIIAHEIERVIQALTSQHFSRHSFLHPLDRFYGAIEETAATIDDYSEKQGFLNTVYEQFFQGFSVKVADTHGIVYTPQPIVDFMVLSVEDILRREFDRSLSDEGIHLLDPFVGTGNFILRVMRQIRRSALPYKYAHELHCNEVMLLPYYIAAMNIEHTYYELTGEYHPFDGLCLVDTFELAEQQQMSLFSEQNTERVARQKAAPIFVVIGNPPYNAHQVNENDNSKNRKYAVMDRRVYETYAKDSNATLVNQLSDPYAKAFRWSTDRIGDEGIVALVTNNSFLDGVAFDGMRKHLAQDFDAIYILDLGGNVRKNPKLSGTTHNVFGIQVGVSISLLVKRKDVPAGKPGTIYYARVGEDWRKEAKYEFLAGKQHIGGVEWQILQPNSRHTWLTEGMSEEFGTFLPMGTKDDKSADGDKTTSIFKTYSNSVKTNNDAYVYNFNQATLNSIAQDMVNVYNFERYRWTEQGMPKNLDEFLRVDETKLKWIRRTKRSLLRGLVVNFDPLKVRRTLYRPFCQQFYFFERIFSEDIYQLPSIFPSTETEAENCTICVSQTSEKPFTCLATNIISDHVVAGGFGAPTQCFPFYTYAEDGSDRRENITDWALAQFRAHYADEAITKWDIFHYVYAILHHPVYRETYASNLKRDLPHIPFAPATSASLSAGFWPFVEAGRKLAELHVHYEDQPQYPLQWIENDAAPLTYRVEKMRLAPDKTAL
ncbi:MAG: N-6 DNA methylase, partial [Anaerolineae bacterium]|nr:N-6 DNA methylase [Anaerolineae bacterium]